MSNASDNKRFIVNHYVSTKVDQKTGEPNAPLPENMGKSEIALNLHQGAETLFVKNDNGEIVATPLGPRTSAETERVKAEALRIKAEQSRTLAEGNRTNAEDARTKAEQSRVEAEQARVEAEQERAIEFAGFAQDIDKASKQYFIDLWNAAAGKYGCYNEATGFFELNGITDIPYAEAMEIYRRSAYVTLSSTNEINGARAVIGNAPCRTLLPLIMATSTANLAELYMRCQAEVIRVTYEQSLWTGRLYAAFAYCTKLRRIETDIYITENSFTMAFTNCYALEHLHIWGLGYSLDLKDCSKLSLDSISFLIANRSGSSGITITLHPDAYARVTDDIFAAAAAKNITIATP